MKASLAAASAMSLLTTPISTNTSAHRREGLHLSAADREVLASATKRTRRAAMRAGKAMTWKEAREAALGWCQSMWGGFGERR